MSILWNEKTAAEATGGAARGSWQASRVVIDSRALQKGDLFVALKGERLDGHDYVAMALEKGAAAAVVSKHPLPDPPLQAGEGELLIVGDTQLALEALGKFARARSKAKIVGVTGSVGKTSAKEMLRMALSAHGATHATSGNYNNHIGTPLSLANLPPEAEFAVFEMGMNHAGEISALTQQVQPHVAAITNVEGVHMEFFASLDAIAEAKAEIFEGVETGGEAILNRDNPAYVLLAARARVRGLTIIGFGEHAEAECRLLDYRATASGCEIKASIHGKALDYTLGAVGKHWAIVSLLTLAVTHTLGLDDEKTAKALAGFSELEGRGRMSRLKNKAVLIDDSYNASPASMRAAFAKTQEVWQGAGGKGRRLAALGDMLELGPEAAKLHAALATDIKTHGFDGIFTAGKLMRHLHDALQPGLRSGHAKNAMDLLPVLAKELRPGDILLVKGSHGSHMYELAKALQVQEEKKHAV